VNREIAEDWVRALRSGRYAQGHGALRITDGASRPTYCCLGVLTQLGVERQALHRDNLKGGILSAAAHAWIESARPDSNLMVIVRPGTAAALACPEAVSGRRAPFQATLSGLNDAHVPFTAIADLIEEQWASL
jgi:hypothetical protein